MSKAIVVRSLAECEAVIENFVTAWYKAGEALKEINERRLYKDDYSTFEDYLARRWHWSRGQGYRQIYASEVVGMLPRGNIPKDEYQARALVPLTESERLEVARRVVFADVTASVVRKVAAQVRAENIAAHTGEAVANLTGDFRAIVIDPPWPIEKIAREERPKQIAIDYPTMTLEQIGELPVANLTARDGCHVYLWTTHKHLPHALDLFETWGVRYQCVMTWVKNVGFTPFSWMYSTEHALFGRIGKLDLLQNGLRLDFAAKVREHSRKPDDFYELVRKASPEPRLEMFAREAHEGFTAWGNEIGKF